MSGLKPFRFIPDDISQWSRWMRDQSIPDPVSDTFIRGTAQFFNQGSVPVTLDEESSDYIILVDGGINETFWATSKTTIGFTLNSSNSSSTAIPNWVLMR